jgi:hypothetical protein
MNAPAATVAGDQHWRRKAHDPLREGRSQPEHLDDPLRVPAGEHPQVEARREVTLAAAQQDDGAVALGLVERLVQCAQHVQRERVDLAIVHRDRRDGALEAIVDESAHRSPLSWS